MTPKKAVAIGTLAVNLPVVGIMVGGLIASSTLLHSWLTLLGCTLSIATAWFYWSLAVPLWREWAHRSGADPDETQALAQQAGLVWKRHSVFEKTEIQLGKPPE
jgi:hypothetical protein